MQRTLRAGSRNYQLFLTVIIWRDPKPNSLNPSEIKDTCSQLDKALKETTDKDKEIIRKDRALAAYAAKVVAMRNFQKLFADDAN